MTERIRTNLLLIALIVNVLLLLVSSYKFFTLNNLVGMVIYLAAAVVWVIVIPKFYRTLLER